MFKVYGLEFGMKVLCLEYMVWVPERARGGMREGRPRKQVIELPTVFGFRVRTLECMVQNLGFRINTSEVNI